MVLTPFDLLWYDFWIDPFNPQTRTTKQSEQPKTTPYFFESSFAFQIKPSDWFFQVSLFHRADNWLNRLTMSTYVPSWPYDLLLFSQKFDRNENNMESISESHPISHNHVQGEDYEELIAAVDKLPSSLWNDAPSVVESDVSSLPSFSDDTTTASVVALAPSPPCVPEFIRTAPTRTPLQWEFHGLTLWLEYEEFDNDLTKANYNFASKYGTDVIPAMHSTAIYGMTKFSVQEAKERLHQIPSVLPNGTWPIMEKPVAVKQDIAVEGRPGQVCSIAWAELTLKSNEEHEKALDAVCELFETERTGPWTPHLSLAYDNPEDTVLNLSDMIQYVGEHPSLLGRERRIKCISLWDTQGKLGDWKCLDKVDLY